MVSRATTWRYSLANDKGGSVFVPPAHALIGWAIAHVIRTPDRPTRLWCVLAAVVADFDSLGLLFGWSTYERYHHVLLHNLTFGVAVTLVSVAWIGLRPVSVTLVFASFVSHLVGDYFGSGAGWGISPFLPFSNVEYVYTMVPRDVLLPNIVANVGVIVLTLVIAVRTGRTPLEFVHAGTERLVVDAIQLRAGRVACAICGTGASVRCTSCSRPLCATHATSAVRWQPRCTTCEVGTSQVFA